MVSGVGGRGIENRGLMETEFQLYKMQRVLWVDGSDGLTTT